MEKNIFAFHLIIKPTIKKHGRDKTEYEYAKKTFKKFSGLERNLVEENKQYLHITKIEEAVKPDDFFKLKCYVLNDAELEDLKHAIDSGELSKRLTEYGMSIGLDSSLGIKLRDTDSQLELKVSFEPHNTYNEGKAHFRASESSEDHTGPQRSKPLGNESQNNENRQTNFGGSFHAAGPTGATGSRYLNPEFYVDTEFHVYVPVDRNDVKKVIMKSDIEQLNGNEMINQSDSTHLWYAAVKMDPSIFSYTFKLEIHTISYTSAAYLTWKKLWKDLTFKVSDKSACHYHIMKCSETDSVGGCAEFCISILQSVNGENYKQCIMQLDSVFKTTYLDTLSAGSVVNIIQQHFKCISQPPLCIAFLAVLGLAFKPVSYNLCNYVKNDVANSILCALRQSSIEEIPSFCQEKFEIVTEHLCRKATGRFSVIEMMWHAYPYFHPSYFINMLDYRRHIPVLEGPLSDSSSKQKSYALLKALYHQVTEGINAQGNNTLLEKIQNGLPLETFLYSVNELSLSVGTGEKYKELLNRSKEKLLGRCKPELQKLGNCGYLDKLLNLWDRMRSLRYIEISEIHAVMEDAVLNAVTKTCSRTEDGKLEQTCLDQQLFAEKERQKSLLLKLAESKSVDIRKLVVTLLKHEKFKTLDENDVEDIAFLWFDVLMKKHVGDRKKPDAIYIPRLYSSLADLFTLPLLSENRKLRKDIEDKACEFLQDIDIKDILKKSKDIEADSTAEDVYKSHVQKILYQNKGSKSGNKTVNSVIKEICGTTSLLVNSRLTEGIVETLLELTGLSCEMPAVDTLMVMSTGKEFWEKVLNVQGSKARNIKNHFLYKKAKDSIKLIYQELTKGTIECRTLKTLRSKTEDVLDVLSYYSKTRSEIQTILEKGFECMTKNEEKCKVNIAVLRKCSKNVPKGKMVDFIMHAIEALLSIAREIENGSVTLKDLQNESVFNSDYQDITDNCSKLQVIVESKVFWNICEGFLTKTIIFEKEEEESFEDDVLRAVSILLSEQFCISDVCSLLQLLVDQGISQYDLSWKPYICGNDVKLSVLQKQLYGANIISEIDIAKRMGKELSRESKDALVMYDEFEKHVEKVTAMKNALIAFNVDASGDSDFSNAVVSFEQLCDGEGSDEELERVTLFCVHSALKTIDKVTGMFDGEMTDILMTIGNSQSLIEFLQEVADEDIRNLIDAVEEHSEQYVQESTVSCLIDVKRVFQPLLNRDYSSNVEQFITEITGSASSSGVTNIPHKLDECMSNIHSLKALYSNVANRGQRTKEIVANIVKKGEFHFILAEKTCKMTAEYKQDEKMVSYAEAGLNDLRSRALLMMNTEEKKKSDTPSETNSEDYLSSFVSMVEISFEIENVLRDLQFSGHFDYTTYDRKVKPQELENIRDVLLKTNSSWCYVLDQCRKKYYFMNFVYSDQLQLLYQYFENGTNARNVVPVLKYIHPEMKVSDTDRHVYRSFASDATDSPALILEGLGKTLHSLLQSTESVERKFKIHSTSKKISETVQESKLYVAALEKDSQLTIRTILALYLNTTSQLPEAHQILFCSKNTKQDEISLLLHRCIGAWEHYERRELFCIANVEMMSSELQFILVDKLQNMPRDIQYYLFIVCRGDERHPFLDQFRDCTFHPKPLTDVQMEKCFGEQFPNTFTITSLLPGLGKTEQINKEAREKSMDISTLHISGLFEKKSLVERLVHLKVKSYTVLHIDIGMIDSPVELDSFLFQLIILGCVTAGTTSFYLPTKYIYIEVANTLNHSLWDSLPTLTYFKRQDLKWKGYTYFRVSSEINSPVQVVCNYLKHQEEGNLDKTDICFVGKDKIKPLSTEECQHYLQTYFSTVGDPSFTLINIFLNVLADQLKKLSASIYFKTPHLIAMLGAEKPHTVKTNLVNALIDVSKEFSARSIYSCRSMQSCTLSSDIKKSGSSSKHTTATAEVLAKRVEGMIRWEDSNHLMVLFHQDVQTISALFRDIGKVPEHVKNLIESQINKKLEDFNTKSQTELQGVLQRLSRMKCQPMDQKTLKGMAEEYALTPDNLLKMVLITLRITAHIPVIIMGETGCGKTSLVRYLAQICGITFKVLSIHAGVTEEMIVTNIMNTNIKAKEKNEEPVWLFLDEINTCDHLGLICDVVCHHKCLGVTLAPNIVFIAACNPYRLREEGSILTPGLQGKIGFDELSRLVYRVHPLPETMVDFVWDFGSLNKKDENAYIYRMVHSTFEDENMSEILSELLAESQAFVRSQEGTESCVSLRDVDRCKRLVIWFVDILKKKAKLKSKINDFSTKTDTEILTTSIILALALCYHSRFSGTERRTKYRNLVSDIFKKHGEKYGIDTESTVAKVIQREQRDIIDRMDLPEGTAKNTALQENVFVILVCILNRIPVFVVGKPGCSKSLSMQLIRSNMRGKDSRDPFFQTLPQLYCVSFQGSESSTSDGIIKVFEKAKKYQEHNKIEDVMSVVILDEIGLAEISRFNPLKVLHSLLEPENQICPDVAVVGLSNWALDAAKMNRAIHLSRPEMDEEQLFQTGISISESIMIKPDTISTLKPERMTDVQRMEIEKIIRAVAKAYHEYNRTQTFTNFHGLRDYYCLTKHISKMFCKVDLHGETEVCSIVLRGILRNFGGLPSELETIKSIFQKHLDCCFDTDVPVLELIQENIFDRIGRHLMLITSGDAVVSNVEQLLRQNDREYIVIFGSQFEEDLTDDYNYRILSRIILCMEEGLVLILKDLESIYGSLYDMLNQNYTVVGKKKNCRVALGAYNNPMCQVHDDFKCIVLVEDKKLDYSDPPFLNRFEKQQFRFSDILNETDCRLIDKLKQTIAEFCSVEKHLFTPCDAFPIYSADMLASLVLYVKATLTDEISDLDLEEICFQNLLSTATPEAVIRVKKSAFWSKNLKDAKAYLKEYLTLPLHQGLEHYISSQAVLLKSIPVLGDSCVLECNSKVYSENETALLMTSVPCERGDQQSFFAIFTHSSIHVNISECIGNRRFQAEKVGGIKTEKQLMSRIQSFFKSDREILVLQLSTKEDARHILLTKAAVENYHSIFQKENTSLQKKHVFMVIHLERKRKKVEKHSISQLNFLSGWTMVTLDSLERPLTPLPHMIDMTVLQVLRNRRPFPDSIKEQLFWAFTRIHYTSNRRSVTSMKELLQNMQQNSEFLNDVENVIFEWIENEMHFDETMDWHVDIACNSFELGCATTFIGALENHILYMIKIPLAMLIYQLEECNAAECYFIEDSHTKIRRNIWQKCVHNSSFLHLGQLKPPTGPECYNCTVPSLQLKMPFSQIIISRVEQLKGDFLDTLSKLRLRLEIEEDDVPLPLFLNLALKYQDVVVQEIGELIHLDYEGRSEDYIHDYCLFIVSKYLSDIDEEIGDYVLKWQFANYISLSIGDFCELITHLHTTFWTYSPAILAMLQLAEQVKSVLGAEFVGLIQHFSQTDIVSTSFRPPSEEGIEHQSRNESKYNKEYDETPDVEIPNNFNEDECIDITVPTTEQSLHDTGNLKSLTHECEDRGKELGKTEEITEEKDDISSTQAKDTMSNPVAEDTEEIAFDEETLDKKELAIQEDLMSSQEHFLRCICNKIFPSRILLEKMTFTAWEQMVNRVLPLLGDISLELKELHGLRFCSDVANVLVIPYKLPLECLFIFGEYLQHSPLDSAALFQLLMEQLNVLHSKHHVCGMQLQRIFNLYIGRCLACNPDCETVMKNVLMYISEGNLVDADLSFLGPTLEHVIQVKVLEEEDALISLLCNGSSENELINDINHCLCQIYYRGTDSAFPYLLVDILEKNFLEDLDVERIETSNDEIVQTALLAHKIHREECFGLRYVLAIAYLRAYLKQFSSLIGDHLANLDKYSALCINVNPLLKAATDSELDIRRSKELLIFMLKCLSDGKSNTSVQKTCKSASCLLTNLKEIGWNSDYSLSSLEYSPYALHCPGLYSDCISVLTAPDHNESSLKKLVADSLTSEMHMIAFIGGVINRYTIRKKLVAITDDEKSCAKRLLEIASGILTDDHFRILEFATGEIDYGHEMYHFTSESPENESYMVSVLLHMLCILTTFECKESLLYKCMMKPALIEPNVIRINDGIGETDRIPSYMCCCRYVSKENKCPVCAKTNKSETLGKKFLNEKTSFVSQHIIEYFISGCLMNSLALQYSDVEDLQTIFGLENKDEIPVKIQERLFAHWRALQSSLCMDSKDLCAVLNITLLRCRVKLTEPFILHENTNPSSMLENLMREIIDETIQIRFTLLQKHRCTVYQANNVPIDAIECQLDELFDGQNLADKQPKSTKDVIKSDMVEVKSDDDTAIGVTNMEENATVHNSRKGMIHQPSYFRSTAKPTKASLYAELHTNSNYKSYQFLSLVLHNLNQLSVLQFITPLLKWHMAAVSFASYTIRKVDCKEITIRKLFTKVRDEKAKEILRKCFKNFEDAWNGLKGTLADRMPLTEINQDMPSLDLVNTGSKVSQCIIMDNSSPLYIVLCLLVQMQNMFLDEVLNVVVKTECPGITYVKTDKKSAWISVVPLMNIEDRDVIKFEWTDDVLKYSQYASGYGYGKYIQYDFAKIEMEMAHEILLGKPYICLPEIFTQILFTDELFQSSVNLMKEIRSSIPQERLTSEIIKGIERKKDNDTTEFLTALGMILTILKKTGGDSSLALVEYIENWKEFIWQASFKRFLPEPEHCLKLCHTVALYEWFEELNGESVCESLDESYRIQLPSDAKTKLESTEITLLEKLGRSLKVFVHRCLSSKESDIDKERPLIDYICDPTFWQEDIVDGDLIIMEADQPQVKLDDVVSKRLLVEHIYEAVCFIRERIEEHKQKDKRISSIVASFQTIRPETGVKPKKGRIARKGFGKT